MNLNADVGEGAGEEELVLAQVDSANIACAAHAGSIAIAVATALRCAELGVEVGAHPGYVDLAGFGRMETGSTVAEIEAIVAFQVAGLAAVVPITYVKPHGALYHRCSRDAAAAEAVARVAARHGAGILASPRSELLAAAQRAGVPAYREGFADRLLLPDGGLAPRDRPGAVLGAEEAAKQAVELARSGDFDSLCVHGDSPDAGRTAAAVRAALREAGIDTAPLKSAARR